MSDISGLSSTDATNATLISGINMAENCDAAGVNNAIRALAAMLKRDWEKRGPTLTSAGSANAQTLTYPVPVSPLAYVRGDVFSFVAGFTNTGPATMSVDGIGAIAIQRDGAALTGGEIVAGRTYMLLLNTAAAAQLIGSTPVMPGGLIGLRVFTTPGAGTYTPTPGTNSIVVDLVGAGGAGGGCSTTSGSQIAVGSNGGAGAFSRKRITSGFAGAPYVVGAKGASGTAGNNPGTAGGTTSWGSGPVFQASGGNGGGGGPASGVPVNTSSTGGGTASNGDLNIPGGESTNFINTALTVVTQSNGAAAPVYGHSKAGAVTATGTNGVAATGYGNGGSGGLNTTSQGNPRSGGNGSDGLIVVSEYS